MFWKLWDHRDYKPLFEGFLGQFTGRPALPPQREKRVWVALLRAVENLEAAEETWGMERSWQELHKENQLGDFLSHSLNCEAIMLDRERDLKRLSKCRPPSRYLDVLAGEDTVLDRDEIEHLIKSGVHELE